MGMRLDRQPRFSLCGACGLTLALALTFVFATPAECPVVPMSGVVEERTQPPSEDARRAILKMVRQYRLTADEEWRRKLADAIYHEAKAADVDPLIVASIIASESSFQSRVVSTAGAVGLMQLRPFVAEDVARRRNVEWYGVETLHSPELNVRLGVLYFKELVERFDGDEINALAAYNRGPTRVSHQLRNRTFRGSRYADRILERYRSLSLNAGAGT
jgi:soluble lytic murein transglycosylase-like protein